MKKKLLLTGYGGFAAGSIILHAKKHWDIHALSIVKPEERRDGFASYQFDLQDTRRLQSVFTSVAPDVVIHTAALADIDYCQTHPADAEAINVGVTQELARLCGNAGVRMIFCSTDSVFDGIKGYYVEEDAPNPVNFYAETKVRAEQAIQTVADNAVIVRLSLVMGLPVLGAGNSFLAKMVSSLEAGQDVFFPENEIRTPLDVITLGRAFLELASLEYRGILHLAGCTRLNRYEMARQTALRLGFSPKLVRPTNSNAMSGRAQRPDDASLNNSRVKTLLSTPMRPLEDALELILQTRTEPSNGNA